MIILAEEAGILELKRLQALVYSYGNKDRDAIFKGSGGPKKLNLLYHDGHYNVITSLTAAFACDYFCEECAVPYNIEE